jgi:hydroxymethylglutaryl-CoA synthase
MTTTAPVGISSIGVQLPALAMKVEELAELRGVDPNKFTKGLGCRTMALCSPEEGVVSLAAGAARRALERWGGDLDRIGMIAVGTETAMDMSRPVSAWVAEELDLKGAMRSYEVKHACYGGTLALRQALEWKLSGAAQGKAALVIASDVALYAEQSGGEPTQGAGAVAMIVDDGGVATVDPVSFPYAEPAFDFWRPVGQDHPNVEGQLSLDCYMRAAEQCFGALIGTDDPEKVLGDFKAMSFHVPFPKMVKKAAMRLGETLGLKESTVASLYEDKIDPALSWNRETGNSYTASLWTSVAGALAGCKEGERIAAFSYGSGYGAELLTLRAGPLAEQGAWVADYEADCQARRLIDASEYTRLREGKVEAA